ncbi:tripartite tricarboxylate transporter TctB family protein [Caproiciproducens sp. NJN-50]|uniref:tripartite tricarboxylate transporter TctB family protein n=1 Tax=Acutalibacteraceae TaxID=3082771 RepID=UPI000FFE0E11|nr:MULTISPECIES: tripartite tricarboxylate transporter TctB family protein [Acutalibacteraceae]QAT50117.1 tripartite tricarboxylate transporter TctB family protein [Caproiciproducens sp. NJN-50]
MKQKSCKIDIVPGIVLALSSIFYLLQIPKINAFKGTGATPLDNHFVPGLWGGVMLVLALFLIFRGWRNSKRFAKPAASDSSAVQEKSAAPAEPFWKKLWESIWDRREVVGSFILMTLYVALMESVGFIITTIVYLFLQILLLTPVEKWKKNIVPAVLTSAVVSVALFEIFNKFLNVLLPSGIFSL